jgi:hypothetical protein
MNDTQVQIRFPTHNVHVQVSDDIIRCFKYNGAGCDFELFTDYLSAGDYIVEPLPTHQYRVEFQDE